MFFLFTKRLELRFSEFLILIPKTGIVQGRKDTTGHSGYSLHHIALTIADSKIKYKNKLHVMECVQQIKTSPRCVYK